MLYAPYYCTLKAEGRVKMQCLCKGRVTRLWDRLRSVQGRGLRAGHSKHCPASLPACTGEQQCLIPGHFMETKAGRAGTALLGVFLARVSQGLCWRHQEPQLWLCGAHGP